MAQSTAGQQAGGAPFGTMIPPTGAPGMPIPTAGGVPQWQAPPPGAFQWEGRTRTEGAAGGPAGGPPSKGGGAPSKTGGGAPGGGRTEERFLDPSHPGATWAMRPDD